MQNFTTPRAEPLLSFSPDVIRCHRHCSASLFSWRPADPSPLYSVCPSGKEFHGRACHPAHIWSFLRKSSGDPRKEWVIYSLESHKRVMCPQYMPKPRVGTVANKTNSAYKGLLVSGGTKDERRQGCLVRCGNKVPYEFRTGYMHNDKTEKKLS